MLSFPISLGLSLSNRRLDRLVIDMFVSKLRCGVTSLHFHHATILANCCGKTRAVKAMRGFQAHDLIAFV